MAKNYEYKKPNRELSQFADRLASNRGVISQVAPSVIGEIGRAINNNTGSYQNAYERGNFANLGGGNQVGTYHDRFGGVGGYYDRNGANLAEAGINYADNNTYNVGGSMAFPVSKSFYNEVNTPLGTLAYGANTPQYSNNPLGNVYGDFTPDNQYYLQALANLLNR